MRFWERSTFLILPVAAYLILIWKVMADFEGIIDFPEAAQKIALEHQWIFWLLGAELIRQAHFLVGENWQAYHRFWSRKVFGGFERWTHRRLSDWTRFRVARALKIALFAALIALALGAVLDVSPFAAPLRATALIWEALPFFPLLLVVIPVTGLIWFLSRGGVETYLPGDIRTRFHDVWGQDHVLARIRESLVLLDRAAEIEHRGGYVPGGLLLWGPPGTGKTLLAEAVAGETGKPYVVVRPDAFIGIGVLKVKSLFRKLRKLALRHGGVIVLFDEADSLGRRGRPARQGPPGQGGGVAGLSGLAGCHGMSYMSEANRQALALREGRDRRTTDGGDPGTLRALLNELSGLREPRGFFNRVVRRLLGMRPKPPPNYRVLVMMATNRPDALDEALLRPGRIDRVYKVGYPSKAGRVRTYQGYFGKVWHDLTPRQIDKLATITPYATGATIKDLVNESLITAIGAGRGVITWPDVLHAKRLKQLGPPEDVEYVERERHAVAVHEACHAVVAYVTRRHLEIDIATIEKGADHLGLVTSIKPDNQLVRWKSEHEADIVVSLASLAGERMFFGEDNSSGVSGDLFSATYLSAMMESYWGMGSGVTSLPALQELEIVGGRSPGATEREPSGEPSEPMPGGLGGRIEGNLVRLLERAGELLREHRREVLCLAHALETHKTLGGDDVVAVIRGEPGPLIDGTIYASDQLYRELEDYHRDAARAHKERGRVEREFPGYVEPTDARPATFRDGSGMRPLRQPPPGAPPMPPHPAARPPIAGAPTGQPLVTQAPSPGARPASVTQPAPAGRSVQDGNTRPSSATQPAPVGRAVQDRREPSGPPMRRSPAPGRPPVPEMRPAPGRQAPSSPSPSSAGSPALSSAGPPVPSSAGSPALSSAGSPVPVGRNERPEFVPWAAAPPPNESPVPVVVGPATEPPPPPPRRRIAGKVWLVVASLLGLVLLSLIAALAVTGSLTGGNGTSADASSGVASPGLLLLLFVLVVAVIVGAGLASVAIKGIRTAQAKAERERDQAHARAQLLAAAMDPDTAMRLLGYDGNGQDRRP